MQPDKNWAISLVGGIMGLFSLHLPWFGINLAEKLPGAHAIGVSPVDLLNLNWLTGGDSVMALNGSLGITTSLLFIAIAIFIAGCFLSMLGWKGCWLMLGGNMAGFIIILGSPLIGGTPDIFPHYGGVVGFAAGVLSFAGLPRMDDLSRLTSIQRQIVELAVEIPGILTKEITQMLNEGEQEVLTNVKTLANRGLVAMETSRDGTAVFASPGVSRGIGGEGEAVRRSQDQSGEI